MKTQDQIIQEAYVGMSLHINESVSDHTISLMKTGKYDPKIRGSATKFKQDLMKSGATQSEMTAQIAWSKHKHLHAKVNDTKVEFNVHDPKTWPPGYSHRGNPVYLD